MKPQTIEINTQLIIPPEHGRVVWNDLGCIMLSAETMLDIVGGVVQLQPHVIAELENIAYRLEQ